MRQMAMLFFLLAFICMIVGLTMQARSTSCGYCKHWRSMSETNDTIIESMEQSNKALRATIEIQRRHIETLEKK